MVVVETQTRQTDRQGSRNDSVSFMGIVDLLTAVLFAALSCDSDQHDIRNLTDKPVVVLGFFFFG